MCLQTTAVKPHQKWHWAGHEIVDPIIEASRTVPGTRNRRYPIDVREFVSTDQNAVVRRELDALLDGLSPVERAQFLRHDPGSFDYRARKVVAFMGKRCSYKRGSRKFDAWLFPDETFAVEGGDCEDLAFALCALLSQSGISQYCLRVAFGTIIATATGSKRSAWDHAWVMYLNEGGAWKILEPLAVVGEQSASTRRPKKPKHVAYEYVPYFVFNQYHLWSVRSWLANASFALPQYLRRRRFLEGGFKPSFAVSIHNSIFDEALSGMSEDDLATVKDKSLIIDVNTLAYDPRDHFDFGYIDEGWSRVLARLRTGKLDDFAFAVHSVGDFYAHSTYGDFGRRAGPAGKLVAYNTASRKLRTEPTYDFAPYAPLPGTSASPEAAAEHWCGKLISGQWWRWYTTYPSELKPGLAEHRMLPDHDAIAVDGPDRGKKHKRYDEAEYAVQFADRRAAAVSHIKAFYSAWRR